MARGFDEVEGPLSRDRARDLIRTTDRDRNGYMRYLFSVDWSKPHNWDLVISTGSSALKRRWHLSPPWCTLARSNHRALDRQRLANLALASRVEATLFAIRRCGSAA